MFVRVPSYLIETPLSLNHSSCYGMYHPPPVAGNPFKRKHVASKRSHQTFSRQDTIRQRIRPTPCGYPKSSLSHHRPEVISFYTRRSACVAYHGPPCCYPTSVMSLYLQRGFRIKIREGSCLIISVAIVSGRLRGMQSTSSKIYSCRDYVL